MRPPSKIKVPKVSLLMLLWMFVRDWSDNERAVRREPSFIEGGNIMRVSAWLGLLLCAGLAAIAEAAQTERLIFLSTQLRPIEEAQKMRNLVLKDFHGRSTTSPTCRSDFRCA